MDQNWNDREPLFLQIRERIVQHVLSGALKADEQLPSVRKVAADLAVNPITVMKAYQLLVDEGILEKKRGLGMYVTEGAWRRLLEAERGRFLKDEWPRMLRRIQQLGLEPAELLAELNSNSSGEASHD